LVSKLRQVLRGAHNEHSVAASLLTWDHLYLVAGNWLCSLSIILTQAHINSIKTLEALGSAVTLIHPRGTFTVYITGIDVEPDTWYADSDDADTLWYSGTINLIEA
jgi:hypothetical protein